MQGQMDQPPLKKNWEYFHQEVSQIETTALPVGGTLFVREVDGDSRHEWIAIYKIFKQKFFIQDHRTKQIYVTV